jgi:hypothetical protein
MERRGARVALRLRKAQRSSSSPSPSPKGLKAQIEALALFVIILPFILSLLCPIWARTAILFLVASPLRTSPPSEGCRAADRKVRGADVKHERRNSASLEYGFRRGSAFRSLVASYQRNATAIQRPSTREVARSSATDHRLTLLLFGHRFARSKPSIGPRRAADASGSATRG